MFSSPATRESNDWVSLGLLCAYLSYVCMYVKIAVMFYTTSHGLAGSHKHCKNFMIFLTLKFFLSFYCHIWNRAVRDWIPISYILWVIVSVGTLHISPLDNSCMRYIHSNLGDIDP